MNRLKRWETGRKPAQRNYKGKLAPVKLRQVKQRSKNDTKRLSK